MFSSNGLMPEFLQLETFGADSAIAVETIATAPNHGPRDALTEFERMAVVVERTVWSEAGNFAHHFVTENRRRGGVAAAEVRMQVAATDGRAENADEYFGGF